VAQLVRARDRKFPGCRFDSVKNLRTQIPMDLNYIIPQLWIKGTKLLLKVIKAIIIITCALHIDHNNIVIITEDHAEHLRTHIQKWQYTDPFAVRECFSNFVSRDVFPAFLFILVMMLIVWNASSHTASLWHTHLHTRARTHEFLKEILQEIP